MVGRAGAEGVRGRTVLRILRCTERHRDTCLAEQGSGGGRWEVAVPGWQGGHSLARSWLGRVGERGPEGFRELLSAQSPPVGGA